MRTLVKNFGSECSIFGFVDKASKDGKVPLFTPEGNRNPMRINDDGEIEPMYSYK